MAKVSDKPTSPPRPPDYTLNCLDKTDDHKGKVGAAWINDDGSIRVVIDPFVVLPPPSQIVLTLFKVGDYKAKPKPAPRTAYDVDMHRQDDVTGDPADDEVHF